MALNIDASVVVSGGVGGLGAATVRRLHADGLAVVICDLAEGPGQALAAELGSRALFTRTDVTDSDSVNAALALAKGMAPLRYGVMAHGGPGVAQRIVGRDGMPADFDAYRSTIDVYLNGTFNLLRLTAAAISAEEPGLGGERGSIVLTSSIAAYEGQIGQAAYAVAKAGVVGMTLAAARDLSAVGVRVNSIAPGTMKTPIMESLGVEAISKFAASVPFPKRLGAPEEYADAAAFLLGNQYVNGEVLRLDGAQRFAPR
ncbi:3-hydroxy-2-methylbutyryl-CoA dehydrogenase [Mycobacterium sp. Root135]|uniref:SDR family oxidoreductase n=1 Tax=Mycobacterium sp. Root135 TaxID=1736457 RepID=UPI0006F95EA4|nr:SDR family oxidoreductase [Mycobacterium sp. Root135]KQY06935.1 3-hydroxy-2-methylbutyryl-CoA dehydrogenase [Mycobacterium sp. Root135]